MAFTDWNEGLVSPKCQYYNRLLLINAKPKISLLQNGNERMIVDIGRGWKFFDVKQ